LSKDGLFLSPSLFSVPTLKATVSLKAKLGKWQDAHDKSKSRETMGSKNKALPKATFGAVIGLSSGIVGCGRPSGISRINGMPFLVSVLLQLLKKRRNDAIQTCLFKSYF
jgi:hypothetical protein